MFDKELLVVEDFDQVKLLMSICSLMYQSRSVCISCRWER
jgi:hypothetical protein